MANEKILVLEDHVPLRDQLQLALTDAGFQTKRWRPAPPRSRSRGVNPSI
ncbi:MAG: response regulator [Chloroflexi bacterium]|nr:response regulator [Chloroflexota bacterium]